MYFACMSGQAKNLNKKSMCDAHDDNDDRDHQ